MAKCEQQGKAIVRIDSERAGLGIAKPAFRNQIVEERVEPLFADVRWSLAWQRESNRRMAGFQVCRIVSKRVPQSEAAI